LAKPARTVIWCRHRSRCPPGSRTARYFDLTWTGAYNLDFDTDSLIATIRQVGAAERVGIVSVAEGGAHVVCTDL
jgi:hypothetical protein